MKFKRIFCLFLCFALFFNISAFADTDVNVDGSGGGNLGTGTQTSYWTSGDDGIRVTIVDPNNKKILTRPVDFSNKEQVVDYYFGMGCKYHYRFWNSAKIGIFPGYTYKNIVPTAKLPKVIYGDGTNNIANIRNYFREQVHLKAICEYINFDYNSLINDGYVLIIEPIAYLTFNGYRFTMTATEAAKYNSAKNQELKNEMGSLTHCNLPRSMFLQHEDMNISVPTLPFEYPRSGDDEIERQLGIGIIRFIVLNQGEDVVAPSEYEYYTDTDVITSFNIKGKGYDVTPDSGEYVEFDANGEKSSKEFVCPAKESQLVWVKWHTPSEPGTYKVKATVLGKEHTVYASVVEYSENIPPHTKYEDKKPDNWYLDTGFHHRHKSNMSATWGFWEAYMGGSKKYPRWEYRWVQSTVNLAVKTHVKPDSRVKTAIQKSLESYDMKSGYGVNVIVETDTCPHNTTEDDFTDVQIVSARFPEFEWKTYNRLLEKVDYYSGFDSWQLKQNEYSYYSKRVHFTPLWYPDKTDYPVYVDVCSAWTPAGQLFYTRAANNITINGSCYDDWYIALED